MVNRDLLLREVVSFLKAMMNDHTYKHTHMARKGENALCSRLFPNNHFYLLPPFDLVTRHYYLILLFWGGEKSKDETALFNSANHKLLLNCIFF